MPFRSSKVIEEPGQKFLLNAKQLVDRMIDGLKDLSEQEQRALEANIWKSMRSRLDTASHSPENSSSRNFQQGMLQAIAALSFWELVYKGQAICQARGEALWKWVRTPILEPYGILDLLSTIDEHEGNSSHA
ncbi:hypothetical protein BGAL_0012g00100 [Botrytis galanthina]|uniref:Uncharacterized protein n=1 Tax=Botrytis galanthina TaxID=278940 RepID=A0A4S8RD13_9HELO|nr:hypothetical protein BGAL_0012g00100 [Botrytis galanthina]